MQSANPGVRGEPDPARRSAGATGTVKLMDNRIISTASEARSMRGVDPLSRPPGASPLLLASVRSVEEAISALAGGADLLDVKEPREGSLGAAPPAALRAIVSIRDAGVDPWAGDGSPWQPADEPGPQPRKAAVSAALGDAPYLPGTLALAAAGAAGCGVDIVKFGLHGVRDHGEAVALIRAVVEGARSVSPRVRVVAAAYADAARIGSLPPALLVRACEAGGADGCLIDTAIKDGTTLLDHLDAGALSLIARDARGRGLFCALAGSIGHEELPEILKADPDLIGARTSLCDGGRQGALRSDRVAAFRRALRGVPNRSALTDRSARTPRAGRSAADV